MVAVGMVVSAQRGGPVVTDTEHDARWSRSAGRGAVPVVLATNEAAEAPMMTAPDEIAALPTLRGESIPRPDHL